VLDGRIFPEDFFLSSHPTQSDAASLIVTEQHGAILVATLNRAAKRNALNDSIVFELERVMTALPAGTKVVVLQGAGDHFSAGLDLSELKERDTAEGIAHSMSWHRVFEKVQFGTVPVVTVLKGAVVGGGLELASSTHVRVAETSAFYAFPEGQRGIYVGGGGSVRVPRIIGVDRMMDMMLTGRTYSAAEGYQLGLSQYLVEPGQGLPKAMELAGKIAGNAGMTNFALINALPRIADMDRSNGFMMEALMAGVAQAHPDAKERVRAFLDKKAAKVTPTS
jgi:(methylthio)acryloyl-CoA hydratase